LPGLASQAHGPCRWREFVETTVRAAITALVVLVSPCCAGATHDAASREAIDEVRDGFAVAYARGDVEELLRRYDRDYVDVSTGVAVRGRDAMRDAFEDTFERFQGHLEIRRDEVLINGNWAIERGTFSIHLLDRSSGAEQVSRRRYLEVLVRRGDGRWYILRDLDNEGPGDVSQ
jgi:ketosteroid isomerase-like protein